MAKAKNQTAKGKSLLEKWDIGRSFQYAVEYDYDDGYGPEHATECAGICRCRSITHVRIKSVNADYMTDSILRRMPKAIAFPKDVKPFLKYAINRIVTHSGALNPDIWRASVSRGYYGEEISDVYMEDGAALETINSAMNRILLDPTPKRCVHEALKAEYGYVLPEIESLDWTVASVPYGDVTLPTLHGYVRLDRQTIKQYESSLNLPSQKDFPIALVVNGDMGKYRLIDGRHRYLSQEGKRKKIPVLLGGV